MFEKLFNERAGLSLERLRSFVEVAKAGSIVKAAPDDKSRQSAMSRSIRDLEEYFATELTVRRGKRIAISEEGKRLAIVAEALLRDLEEFRSRQAGERKTFVIGSGASTTDWLVVPAIGKIRRLLDDATISLETLRSRDLVQAVADGSVDFAIVREDALPEGEKCKRRIARMSFHLCIPAKLVRQGTTPQMLDQPSLWARLPFVAGKGGGQLDTQLRKVMADTGVEFHPVVECKSMLQARQFIERGECAGVLPSMGLHGLSPKSIHIRDFKPFRGYGRHLVLHWNVRQMRRRDVADHTPAEIANAIREC